MKKLWAIIQAWRKGWADGKAIARSQEKAIQDLGGDRAARYYIVRHMALMKAEGYGVERTIEALSAVAADRLEDMERQRVNDYIRGIGR